MRSTKTQEEIEELERAAVIGYKMHTTAMKLVRPGVTEKYVAGQVSGIAHSYGAMVSFPTIFSQHGEIQHGYPSMNVLEEGRLALCDAGAETMNNYCSDNTRTMPVSGKFSQRQLEIYSIVEECHDHALDVAKPGVKWADVHFSVCRLLFDRMKELGLAKGDTEEAVKAGAHAMFLPHGLGHMMGMDVHDMENLDQINVGFDEEVRPNLEQFGTNCLRMGRRLQEGFVVTDEPGVYFILPSSTTGRHPVTVQNSSTSTRLRPIKISVVSELRTMYSSPKMVADSWAKTAYLIIQKMLRSSWQPTRNKIPEREIISEKGIREKI